MNEVRDGATIRKTRLEKIISTIGSAPEMEESKLKILMALETGLTSDRIERYVNELIGAGKVFRESGRLVLAH